MMWKYSEDNLENFRRNVKLSKYSDKILKKVINLREIWEFLVKGRNTEQI